MNTEEFIVGKPISGGWVDGPTYEKVRHNFVVATTDVMIVNNKEQVLLGYRLLAPKNYWWIFGGRMHAGESFMDSASRHLSKEFGLDHIDYNNFLPLNFYSLYWNVDEEIDHALLKAFVYKIKGNIKLKTPHDHESIKWFQFNEVLEGDFHPCLKQMLKDYQLVAQKQDY